MIQLENSDTLYLSSDGYPDQFGGQNHKKFSRTRLKDFLQTIQICSLPEQGDRLYEELEKWREEKNEDQTDDIMVIGIRI
jgi:serine phosphatase RsbU (regulator of sigma subunit)